MGKDDLTVVLIRMLGLVVVVYAIVRFPFYCILYGANLFYTSELAGARMTNIMTWQVVAVLVDLVIHLICGYLIIVKSRKIAGWLQEKTQNALDETYR